MKLPISDHYELPENELNNLVYLICRYTINWPMRGADLAICNTLRDQDLRGTESVQNLLEVATEYLWDHMLGEPEDITPQELQDHMIPILENWYRETTPEERSNIN